jgi:hypothetical protein
VPAVTSGRFPVVPVGRDYPSWETSVQRPLWASASTESPLYPDTVYAANLFGRDTVNTQPSGRMSGHWRLTVQREGKPGRPDAVHRRDLSHDAQEYPRIALAG